MVFYWRRRRKWWRGRRRPWYKRRRKTTNKRRRRYTKRRYRRTARRRRRGRKKVRKKLQKIKLAQWQPSCIRKCKIHGIAVNCLGGHGKQFQCYTDTRFDWVPATAPGGGGFGCEVYNLQYLFREWQRGNNTWSTSNENLDLCRYTGARFRFYRHRWLDFIVQYSIQYPFTLDKYTYPLCHPYAMLKSKHHKIIPSWKTYPKGKRYVTLRIKPTKQLTTTWHFQHTFAEKSLLQLQTAVCDLNYSYLGCCNTNQLITFYALNVDMFTKNGWGNPSLWGTHGYKPNNGAPTSRITYSGYTLDGKKLSGILDASTYKNSISYEEGWFQKNLLQIVKFDNVSGQFRQDTPFITAGRYNPTIDTGTGNAVWVVDVLSSQFVKPAHDKTLILEDMPLWQALYGLIDYIEKIKGDQTILRSGLLVIQSPYIFPKLPENKYWIILDKTMIKGEGPYSEYVTTNDKETWFPDIWQQQQTINAFVQCGPFIPKLENQRESTWELKSGYDFYFKWGGEQPPYPDANDPSKQTIYTPPGDQQQGIQISDPTKQTPAGILHTWDIRRGSFTRKAIKRMLEDQAAASSFQTDSEPPTPKKKKYSENTLQAQTQEAKKIQACLQQLCEENIYQETQETTSIQQLIQQQQLQQQQLKQHLLQLISNLRLKQQALQLHTGVLD